MSINAQVGLNTILSLLQEFGGDLSGRGNSVDRDLIDNDAFAENDQNNLTGETGRNRGLIGKDGEAGLFRGLSSNVVVGTTDADELKGTRRKDIVFGDAGDDRISGGRGNDLLFGGDGADQIDGGIGRDVLFGDAGDDRISGGRGNDLLSGGDGADQIDGGIGRDVLFGDAGDDQLLGNAGNDLLLGGDGSDQIDGGIGRDILFGEAGNDLLSGGIGKDLLSGGDGDDSLAGGRGNDQLVGGNGVDQLAGGAGRDQFIYEGDVFANGTPALAGQTGINVLNKPDIIQDFKIGTDQFVFDSKDLKLEELKFQKGNSAQLTGDSNVIVLTDPFPAAGAAARAIANNDNVTADQGIFVYFNSTLGLTRMAYSSDLSDGGNVSVLANLTNQQGAAGLANVANFSASDFALG